MKTYALVSMLVLSGGVASAQEYPSSGPINPYAQPQPQPRPEQPNVLPDPNGYNVPPDQGTEIDSGDGAYEDDLATADDDGGGSLQAAAPFEDTLAPYGNWVDDPEYGHVWAPSQSLVGSDFEPYASNGNWVNTEYGWTWNSGYDWGWAPFHYGRWAYGSRGWCWRPGRTWGPGWVTWRSGGGYVGWAPLGPHGPRGGYAVHGGHGLAGWHFANAGQLGSRSGYLPGRAGSPMYAHTSPVRNVRSMSYGGNIVRYNGGPVMRDHTAGRLADVAPRAMPRFAANHDWHGGQQSYRGSEPSYRGAQQNYRAPQQMYRAPQQSYRGPMQYRAPQQYRAPAQSYRAPTFRPAPSSHGTQSFHGSSSGSGFHGSAGGGGGHGGGHSGRR